MSKPGKPIKQDERAMIETLLKLNIPRKMVAEITGRSMTSIKRIDLGIFDIEKERSRLKRLKKKEESLKDAVEQKQQTEESESLESLVQIIKNIDKQLRLICKKLDI